MLGELEKLVLLAILQCGDEAHALRIREMLSDIARHPVSRSSLYTTLDRLEAKGLVTWQVSESTPPRGGIPRREFRVTEAGLEPLRASHATWRRMAAGLDELLSPGKRS